MPDSEPHNNEAETDAAGGKFARLQARVMSLLALDSRFKVATVVALVVGVLVGLAWVTRTDQGPTAKEELETALELLEDRAKIENRVEARKIAEKLDRLKYRDPDFSGGPQYVLGIVAFRSGMDADTIDRKRHFVKAVHRLREAEQHALESRFLPEWNYALGISLFEAGAAPRSMPYLEKAIQTYPAGRIEAGMRLSSIYLDRKRPAEMRKGVQLLAQLLNEKSLRTEVRDRALLRVAMLHLALNEQAAARGALKQLSNVRAATQATRVFRARTMVASANVLRSRREVAAVSAATHALLQARAAREYRTALKELRPVERSTGLDTTYSRQASYLLGLCSENLAELDSLNAASKYDEAINFYLRTARDYPESHEAVVASLRAARLLRISGRNEEAVQAYRTALKKPSDVGEFHNRWMGLEEFRTILAGEWRAWMDQNSYWEAIELSRLMSVVFPPAHTQELNSLAHREWAQSLENDLRTKPDIDRKAGTVELQRRRRLTGRSFAKLAELLEATNRYSEILWISAGNYREGHDFENALKQYTAYIESQPKDKLPEAYVERGRVLMDLDRLKEAREHFQKVLDAHPKSTAAYVARFLLAQCLLESGDAKQAERMWRKTLTSRQLKPTAREWRLSLFSLGRHLFHLARIDRERAAEFRRANNVKQAVARRDSAKARLAEAVLRLEEYLGRYPATREAIEARLLLAKTLQERADIESEHAAEADVDYVRTQHRNRGRAYLRGAIAHYRKLQTDLLLAEDRSPLDDLHKSFLRDCYFESAHALYALEDNQQAITAYTAAANTYPEDPHVLLAYLQMAGCQNRLGDRPEALSLIVQAEVIYRKLPETSFKPPKTTLTRREWGELLQWARRQHQLASKGQ